MIRTGIVIVEDHEIYRDGLKTFIATVPELELFGEAANAEEALILIASCSPDLILMDIKLPGISGIELTQQITITQPDIPVLILTMFDDDSSVFAAMQAGARGYLLKDAKHGELLRAIQAIVEGEAVFGAGIAKRMMQYFAKPVPNKGRIFNELTEREHEVLTLTAQRLSTAEIAQRLDIRPKTVRNYLSSIVAKLQVANRAEAAEKARGQGL